MKSRGVYAAEVVSNDLICREHFRMALRVKDFPPTRPGQFIQLQCTQEDPPAPPHVVEWKEGRLPEIKSGEISRPWPLLRRPFSLAGRRETDEGIGELLIIYRTIGIGTHRLARIGAGQRLSIIGPLGNAFTLHEDKSRALVVGGGVGIPPMVYLAGALDAAGKQTTAFVGARSGDLLPLTVTETPSTAGWPSACVAEFEQHRADAVVVTDDGSLGFPGVVSRAVEDWLGRYGDNPADIVTYCCGPEAMMQTVGETCAAHGVECQVAMERHMACGMGTCQSCIVKTRADNDRGWEYKLCCADGPVFDACDILWPQG